MTEFLIAFIAILAGSAIGYLIGFLQRGNLTTQVAILKDENIKFKKDVETYSSKSETLSAENTELNMQLGILSTQVSNLKTQISEKEQLYIKNIDDISSRNEEALAQAKQQAYDEKEAQKEAYDTLIDHMKTSHAKLREENDKQWSEKLETLKESILKMTMDQLASKQNDLQENNKAQLSDLLKPIKDQFNDFKKSVDESRTQNELNKEQINQTFKSTMDLFQQAQDIAVKTLKEQTEKIGNDASNLTKALKGESKTQGDWGEMVLQTILENSGLHKDEEYFVQENVKDKDGNNYRPDILVRIPGDKGSIVIDSKVSLTAYANAIAEENEVMQEKYLKEHVKSVRKHVDELAGKHYETIVEQTIGFVLMFIPNEYSYIVAMKQDPQLNLYAYQKKIVIISPSNLLMALQLVYNLWQTDKQSKNVEKIVKTAADLYDKVVGFSETFEKVGDQISDAGKAFEKAKNQLYTGKGNVIGRVEKLKEMGVTPKRIRKSSKKDENAIEDQSLTGVQ